MPSAIITINGTPGTDEDLSIGVLVQLDNQDTGGETTYDWTILDQPPGPVDSLSSTTIKNPTFTPNKEGSYLIELIVNAGTGQVTDQQVAGVQQVKTRVRIPASGETIESDPDKGWSDNVVDPQLQALDTFRADPGSQSVSELGGAVTVTAGDVVRYIGVATLKSGLPGEERITKVEKAPATAANVLDEPLGVVVVGVDGSDPVSVGGLLYVRWMGLIEAAIGGTPIVGDAVYVSDTATLSTTPGTNSRQVGKVIDVVGADGDVYFTGGIEAAGPAAGASTFLALTDTPGSYTSQGSRLVAVNTTPDALDFLDLTLVTDTDTLVVDAANRSIYIGSGSPGGWSAPKPLADDDVVIGHGAAASLDEADHVIAIGTSSAANVTDGTTGVVAICTEAGENLGGDDEANSTFIAIGRRAARGAVAGAPQTSVNGIVAVGHFSMEDIETDAGDSIGVGDSSLASLTTGTGHVAVGHQSGGVVTTGSRGIFVGQNTSAPAAGTDDFLNIGDTIYGDLASDKVAIGGVLALPSGDVSLRLNATDQAFMPNVVASTAAVATPEDGMVVYSTADDSLMGYQNGAWAQLSRSPVRFFQKSDLESTTTGTTPISKVQISTGTIVAGTYRLWGTFTWRRASISGDAQFEVIRDVGGTPTVHWTQSIEATDAGIDQRNSSAFSDEFSLTAGSYTFDIMFNNATGFGGVTVGIQQARIWLERVGP